MHRRQTLDTWQCMYVIGNGEFCANRNIFAFWPEPHILWMQRPQTPFQGPGARLSKPKLVLLPDMVVSSRKIQPKWQGPILYFPIKFAWSWQIYLIQKGGIIKIHISKGSKSFGAGYIHSVRVQSILILTCALKHTPLFLDHQWFMTMWSEFILINWNIYIHISVPY